MIKSLRTCAVTLLLFFTQQLYGADYSYTRDVFSFDVIMQSNDTAIFVFTVPNKMYFCIGFGNSMSSVDMLLVQANGVSSLAYDLWSVNHNTPKTDSIQNIDYQFEANTTHVKFYVTRKIATGDTSQDYKIDLHQSYGTFSMKLPFAKLIQNITINGTKGNITESIVGAEDEAKKFFQIHGWILWGAWGIFGFIQLLTTRYFKQIRWSIWIHIISGWLILLATFIMSLLAIAREEWEVKHDFHTILGTIVLAYVGFVNISGFITKQKWLKKLPMRDIHKFSGFLIIIISQVAIISGVFSYSEQFLEEDERSPLGIVQIVIFFFFWIALEIRYQFMIRSKVSSSDRYRLVTMKEFNRLIQEGRKLVILDDLIIDVAKYIFDHPGGPQVLDGNIGRDISKFFYGGYQYENFSGKQDNHAHSDSANLVVASLTIGRLEKNYSKEYQTQLIQDQITAGEQTRTFVFQGNTIRQGLQTFYKDIQMIGKHFLVYNTRNLKAKRHYTICNCLLPEAYSEYLRVIEEFTEEPSKSLLFNEKLINEVAKNRIPLTIKNYKQPRGLSQMIHTEKAGEKYMIKGPLGKGLEIHFSGVHLAFTAGTGCLVFLDLVAHLIRKNLDLLDKEENEMLSNTNFKFIFYLSFPNRQQAIGLALCEGLEKITKAKGKNNFELRVRLSNESKEQWNETFITQQIQNNPGIKRVWVCGPPKMNETFDKTLQKEEKGGRLPKASFEIM
ncbi:cytochrome b5-like heme steroid binding domain containing protein [Stylonychia lemnae]|uniref:Cytochrome b5-like heme steroid binding domain containing protein n=1 Tax=Stylonychia lemnae TaxID=5949 RepID=A0A078A0H3_STYLE|nr:cytochrome b5-like heme steroid binding domain containing protein [Stylonychia lemnae]|eukprot:CDW75650.1 cytochrome b5-like heme steroid binding domain containing protein [Stylonychia lemnae]